MRYATHAGRISKGVPIFVTWSPDENHNTIMMRFYRVRSHDPICRLDKYASHFGKLGTPLLTKAYDDNEILTPEILQSLESTSPDLRMQR